VFSPLDPLSDVEFVKVQRRNDDAEVNSHTSPPRDREAPEALLLQEVRLECATLLANVQSVKLDAALSTQIAAPRAQVSPALEKLEQV
jgi:hypothetical protein